MANVRARGRGTIGGGARSATAARRTRAPRRCGSSTGCGTPAT